MAHDEQSISDDAFEDPYAKHLRPRPRHPILRRLNPRRAWQRHKTLRKIRFEFYGPQIAEGRATDKRTITFFHRDQAVWPVGKVSYLICHQCRRGFIGNIEVQTNHQGHGIASHALAHIRRQVPGYTWRTSLHLPGAKSFWLLIADRTGEDYTDTETDRVCEHMAAYWRGGATSHNSHPRRSGANRWKYRGPTIATEGGSDARGVDRD